MLALGRALGETMAVTFVIGNAHRISASILAPGTTISAVIANEFTEAVGPTLYLFADRARIDPVRHHLHRPRHRALHADAHRAPDRINHGQPLRYSPTPQYRRDRARSGCDRTGARLAGADPGHAAVERFQRLVVLRLHPDDAAAGRGRRTAQSDRWQSHHDGLAIDRDADRRPRRHLHGRIWPPHQLTSVVRFINDILLSAPSIVIGLFIYQVMVAPMGHFSALAGGVALAMLVIPVVVRTTEDMLKLVPDFAA